jgi:hypothetical protein
MRTWCKYNTIQVIALIVGLCAILACLLIGDEPEIVDEPVVYLDEYEDWS